MNEMNRVLISVTNLPCFANRSLIM